MSDGMTDTQRDIDRGRYFSEYISALEKFLKRPTRTNRRKVIQLANKTDDVPIGYLRFKANVSVNLEERLMKLQKGDKETWAKMLFGIIEEYYYEDLKKLSPFKDMLLVKVDYGCGFVNLKGDVNSLFDSIIGDDKGWKTYDTDKYVVAIDKPDVSKAEVFWITSGTYGINSPRKIKPKK
jgi:hypothetical protein